jgi:3-oxoacyl-[acyl-carrier-protein] synthase II
VRRRVAITGMGIVSPLGATLAEYRERLLAGESAADEISIFDATHLPTRIAAEVKPGQCEPIGRDRKVAFGATAARNAVEDANGRGSPLEARDAGLAMGMGLELFSMPDMVRFLDGERIPAECDAQTFLQTPSDACLHRISREHGLDRPPLLHVSACAASTDAIGMAFRLVRDGRRRWMLAGGADSMINPLGVAGFCKIDAMTTRNGDPRHASRPFDRDRDGFLLGEGAGVLVLEELGAALARGARIYGEILGYGNSLDAHGISEPHPEGEGALLAMRRALDSAGLQPAAVAHVNAHGTSTPKNDSVETRAIRRLFGAAADEVTVNATKSMIGHLVSASGAAELIAHAVCASEGWIHPTINLERADPACDLDYVPGTPRRARSPVFLKNSFGFGGQNAALAVAVPC